MDISVIVPTYRPQDYLWECLDALVRQTLSKDLFEVVLVLNGVLEPYSTLIEDYIVSHPQLNIVFVKTPIGGVSNARNLALDRAKGKYITFVDDDDYLSENCLQEMLSIADQDTVAICYPFAFVDGAAGQQCAYGLTKAYDYCIAHNCTTIRSVVRKFFSGPCMKLIPTWMIGDRRYDIRFKVGEDSIFMFLISDCIDSVRFTSKSAVYYRRFRKNSALTSQQGLEAYSNNLRCMIEYSKIYFGKGHYSFYMYYTRILATCMVIWIRIKETLYK